LHKNKKRSKQEIETHHKSVRYISAILQWAFAICLEMIFLLSACNGVLGYKLAKSQEQKHKKKTVILHFVQPPPSSPKQ
jgi:hypothetical protein